jgi:hypothetical protein
VTEQRLLRGDRVRYRPMTSLAGELATVSTPGERIVQIQLDGAPSTLIVVSRITLELVERKEPMLL